MTNDTIWQLQKAVYDKLSGDATLGALITGVFEYVPEGTNFPYVVIDDMKLKPWSNLSKKGSEINFSIKTYCRERGSKTCLDIMDNVEDLLDEAALTVTNHALIHILLEYSEVEQKKDGLNYVGVSKFKALLEETV